MASSLNILRLGIYCEKSKFSTGASGRPETFFFYYFLGGITKDSDNLSVIPISLMIMIIYTVRLNFFFNYKDLEMNEKSKQKVYGQCSKYANNVC